MFPSIAEYNNTIAKSGGSAFCTMPDLSFMTSRTNPVKIYSFGSGSYAVVFKATENGNPYAIRCFISGDQENIRRYRELNDYFKNINAPWVTKFKLLENEIKVADSYYPVVVMKWVQGELLNTFISSNLNNKLILNDLQNEIIRLSNSLELNFIGHGDIQCGNVLVAKDENGAPVIKLIDYDGMYIPAFSNKINLERGRTEFQHPDRFLIPFNERIDRFSFWVILCALEALKYNTDLWKEVMQGGFNTLDNLLFTGEDFKNFMNSNLIRKMYDLNQPSLNFYLNKIRQFCSESPLLIECPVYYNPDLISEQKSEYNSKNIDENKVFIAIYSTPTSAIVLSSDYKKIGITPMFISESEYFNKTLIITTGTQIKTVLVQHQSVINIEFENQNLKKEPLNSYEQENIINKVLESEAEFIRSNSLLQKERDRISDTTLGFFVIFAVIILIIIIILVANSKN